MITAKEIYTIIDAFAPFDTAEDYDNVGILVDCGNETDRVLFALDITATTVEEAKARGCGVLVSHHPTMFGGVTKLTLDEPAMLATKYGISLLAAHTNYDRAANGINTVLAELLELEIVGDFDGGLGKLGELKEPMEPEAFARYVKEKLSAGSLAFVKGQYGIKTVAIGGGASDFVGPAVAAGADALVTGELKHHHGLEAMQKGITAIAAGHFATEDPGLRALCDYIQDTVGKRAECLYSEQGKDPFEYV